MLIVGLTGNIGSGKSTIASVFQCLHIPVYHADAEAKKMYLQEDVLNRTLSIAGDQILDHNGQLDLQALGQLAFADPRILNALNRMIHPLVQTDFREWTLRQSHSPYVIQEAAIIFEHGLRQEYDRVIHVSCPEAVAIERIEKRDHLSRKMIRQRLMFQMSDKEKAHLADFVILNDGTTLVIPQVLEIHQTLTT
ncbi:MAG: dephospho-CoA kinase [Bacteroidales bacterium]|nr:dephospho-CoA kinase [Bacteroidales bacterium]